MMPNIPEIRRLVCPSRSLCWRARYLTTAWPTVRRTVSRSSIPEASSLTGAACQVLVMMGSLGQVNVLNDVVDGGVQDRLRALRAEGCNVGGEGDALVLKEGVVPGR